MNKELLTLLLFFLFSISSSFAQINWSEKIELAPSSFGNNRPRTTNDANGNPMLIWGNNGSVMFSKWNGTDFNSPVQLNAVSEMVAEASWMGPEIASNGDTVYVVYKQIPEDDTLSGIYCIRSFDGGENFESPARVDNIGANLSRFSTVHVDKDGTVYVGFMKFDIDFMEPHWVVSKSTNNGTTFTMEIEASGLESNPSEACDCCPGTITSNGNTVAMLYRNNASNIRDSWASISNNKGDNFSYSMNIDQHNWLINSCPSSGPDGFIIDSTIYSVFMNGASGTPLVYFNAVNINDSTTTESTELESSMPNVTQQNFPRLTNLGNKAVVVWKQIMFGKAQIQIMYTDSIQQGFTNAPYAVTTNYAQSGDATISDERIFVAWQDYLSGSIKYRFGDLTTNTSIQNIDLKQNITISPNPSNHFWNIHGIENNDTQLSLFNSQNQRVYSSVFNQKSGLISIDNQNLLAGIYFLHITNNNQSQILKLIKQ
jgi:hypothetical protein